MTPQFSSPPAHQTLLLASLLSFTPLKNTLMHIYSTTNRIADIRWLNQNDAQMVKAVHNGDTEMFMNTRAKIFTAFAGEIDALIEDMHDYDADIADGQDVAN